ncbi:MAG: hypothetical protein ACKVI4_15875 [Actinomycetales bacterium]
MPARFAEVVDVGAEASGTVAALIASGRGFAGQLSFNLTRYFDSLHDTDSLWQALSSYNVTLDTIPTDWAEALRAAGLDVAAPDEYVPEGRARFYLTAGLVLLLTRELYVRWHVRRMLKAHGMHAH